MHFPIHNILFHLVYRYYYLHEKFYYHLQRMNFTRLDMLHISLIYRINSLGPNIEPCGMPHEIFRISQLHLYIIVCTYSIVHKYKLIKLSVVF